MEEREFRSMRGSELWRLPDPTPEQLAQMEEGLYFCDHCLEVLAPDQDRYCSRTCECLDEEA